VPSSGTSRAAAIETLTGHTGPVSALAITRDGATLYTAGQDRKVLVWDLAGTRRLGRPVDVEPALPGGPSRAYALSPNGAVLAVGHGDGSITPIDVRTLRTLSQPFRAVRSGSVFALEFMPSGRLLAVTGSDGSVALVDWRHGRIVKRLPDHAAVSWTPSWAPTFSADRRLMATASRDGPVRLWAMPSGQPIGVPMRIHAGGVVSLSPDGRLMAVTNRPGTEVLDAATGQRRISLSDDESVSDFTRFTADGRSLLVGSRDGWARLWSTETGRPTSRAFGGHAGAVIWGSFSPDGRTLATGSSDGTVRLWDLPTQLPLGAALPGLPNGSVHPEFTPDGDYLFAITDEGRAFRWDVRASSWAQHACAVAGRTLTRSEWQAALPERDYAPACTR
jgi:WD40 repeat protein